MSTSAIREGGALPPELPTKDIQYLDNGYILVNMSSDVTSVSPMSVASKVLGTIDLTLSQPWPEFLYFVEKCSLQVRKIFGFRPDHPDMRDGDAIPRPALSRPSRDQAKPSSSLRESKFQAAWGSAKIIFPPGSAIDGSETFSYRLVCIKIKLNEWQCFHIADPNDQQSKLGDQGFFHMLRLLRQESSYLGSVRRILFGVSVTIKFVKFDLYRDNLVDIRQTCSIPSPMDDEWIYSPKPLDILPPISEALLRHLYLHPPNASAFPRLISRIAKRQNVLILDRNLSQSSAYGLYIEDVWKPTKALLSLLFLGTFFGSLHFKFDILWVFFSSISVLKTASDSVSHDAMLWRVFIFVLPLSLLVSVYRKRREWSILFKTLFFREQRYSLGIKSGDSFARERTPGLRELKWINTHGITIKDDYFELIPGTLQHLESHLPKNAASTSNVPVVKFVNLIFRSIGVELKRLTKTAIQNIPLPVHNRTSQGDVEEVELTESPAVPFGPADSRNILLCISSLRPSHHKTTMKTINIVSICDDEALFLTLKSEYRKFIGRLRWWFSMRTIIGIRFVHFEVNHLKLVNIIHYSREDKVEGKALPPSDHNDYLYNPRPVEIIPPVGHNTLLEFWHTPENGTTAQVCKMRVPTYRLDVVPLRYYDGLGEAWGIEIIEGRTWVILWHFAALVFVGSATFGLVHGVIRDKLSDSFAISSFLQTSVAVAVALGTLSATVDYTA